MNSCISDSDYFYVPITKHNFSSSVFLSNVSLLQLFWNMCITEKNINVDGTI